jgi:tripartite-type tricarboxylate transporter receptor subunit TctC
VIAHPAPDHPPALGLGPAGGEAGEPIRLRPILACESEALVHDGISAAALRRAQARISRYDFNATTMKRVAMHIIQRATATALVLCAAAFAMVSGAAAQKLSDRPITIIVPYSPGTGPDILARLIGEEIQSRWGEPVAIDNKPGATGNIGTQIAARAAPDGHTLLMTTNPITANISLFKNVPYDPVKSFAPVIFVGTGTLALTIHPSIPANSFAEFVAYARSRPGQIDFGSPGVGGPHHLAMELLKLMTRTDMRHIPYRGSAGATNDLVGGHVSVAFQSIHVILPLAQSNQVRLLAVASRERSRVAPDLPTLQELGLAGFEVDLWYGILAPAGTPQDIVERYNTAINAILRAPQVVEKLAKQGLTTGGGSPERFRDFIANDLAKWQKVVNEAGITVDAGR